MHLNGILLFGGTGVPFGMRTSKDVRLLKHIHSKLYEWEYLHVTGDIPEEQYGSVMQSYK